MLNAVCTSLAPRGSPSAELSHHLESSSSAAYIDAAVSAQFAELAPTGSHHTASPDQPESGFVNFMDWDLRSSEGSTDSAHPVVKVKRNKILV